MAKSNKEKVNDIEVKEPKEVKKTTKVKYIVTEPYQVGSGETLKTYKRGDSVYYDKDVARQFINAKQIKKWQ